VVVKKKKKKKCLHRSTVLVGASRASQRAYRARSPGVCFTTRGGKEGAIRTHAMVSDGPNSADTLETGCFVTGGWGT